MTVLIAGAGIAGLTLGLSLHQVGVPFRIIEAIHELRPMGFGINLQPPAVRELGDLGLAERIDRTGIAIERLRYTTATGQEVWTEPRGREAGYAWPQIAIHRGALQILLHETLLKRVGPRGILGGARVAEWSETSDGIEVVLKDRTYGFELDRLKGSVLVACDGAHSSVRDTLFPDETPAAAPHRMMCRGIAHGPRFLGGRTMTISGGRDAKFVAYPIDDKEKTESFINWLAVGVPIPEGEEMPGGWRRQGQIEDVLALFGDWDFDWLDIGALLRGTETVWQCPEIVRAPLKSWTRGRVALLGDAAHEIHPVGSMGATQSVLDARVLARQIGELGAGAEALAAYEAIRREPVEAIMAANRADGPDAVLGRDQTALSQAEKQAIADGYKTASGLTVDKVNTAPPIIGRMPA